MCHRSCGGRRDTQPAPATSRPRAASSASAPAVGNGDLLRLVMAGRDDARASPLGADGENRPSTSPSCRGGRSGHLGIDDRSRGGRAGTGRRRPWRPRRFRLGICYSGRAAWRPPCTALPEPSSDRSCSSPSLRRWRPVIAPTASRSAPATRIARVLRCCSITASNKLLARSWQRTNSAARRSTTLFSLVRQKPSAASPTIGYSPRRATSSRVCTTSAWPLHRASEPGLPAHGRQQNVTGWLGTAAPSGSPPLASHAPGV